MATTRVTLEVTNILQGGTTCSNPTIEAHLVSGLVMPCPIVNGVIELQLDGLEAGYCFDLIIDCEDCNTCPPQQKRICLCDTVDDCSECEVCTDGICVSNCETEEFCDNGQCKECLTDEHCTCNQECINGECACPPDLPVEVDGCCYECVEGDTSEGGCMICVGNRFVAKECGSFLLDPESCECKECLDTGDCTGDNECCVGGVCECCPGYYFDPTSNGCLPIPDCTDNDDCPDCYTCVNGECEELTCPDGYIRTGIVGSCCVKECDCDNPSCPKGSACVEYGVNVCYCKPCSGTCVSNDDCSDGCGCYDGECSPKPKDCEGACYSSSDCAFGCGCLDGECVPCETLGCNNNEDCLLADGCTCDDGSCVPAPCDKDCVDGDDCPDGCGCKDTTCKSCADVPCTNTDDCPDGCLCNNGICSENPCDMVHCLTPADCGEGCGCKDGDCVPCDSLDCVSTECTDTPGCDCTGSGCAGVDEPCTDELNITKLEDECKLRGELELEDCCGCPDIVLHVTTAFAGSNLTVNGYLRKGTTAASPLLSATGISNELPLTGSVKFISRQDEIEVDGSGAPTGITRSVTQSVTENYAGVDTNTNVFTIQPIGSTYSDLGKNWKVIHICVSVEHVTAFTFDNECEYKSPDKEIGCDSNGSGLAQLKKLIQCKTPIFTWFESTDGTTYVQIRKVYSDRVDSNTYRDDIGAAEGLENCKYYKLTVDCGCDLVEFYSCNGSNSAATKLTFCTPTDLTITPADDCNLEIDIDEIEVCAVMIGAQYRLYINGALEGTYTVNGSRLLFAGGLNIVKTVPITEVKLVWVCDECDECTITKTLSISVDPCDCAVALLSVTVDTTNACTTGISYDIIDGTGPYTVVLKKGTTQIYTATKAVPGTYTYNNVLSNGTYVLQVTDAFGCVKTVGFIISACCLITVTGLTYDCVTQTTSGTITASNSSGTFTIELGSPVVHTFSNGVGAFSEVFDMVDGVYSVKVTDSIDGNCFWIGNLYVGCGGLDLEITPECQGEVSGVSIDNVSGGSAPYLVQMYAGSPVTVDGNGCPTNAGQLVNTTTTIPSSYFDASFTDDTEVLIKMTDALGRTKCFHPQYMLDCAENSFTFTTRYTCDGTTKKICVTANKTATYSISIDGDTPFNSTLTAGVEKCFTTVLVDGTYDVELTNGGSVTVTKTVVVTTCNAYTAFYDCTSGLNILEDGSAWTGKIRVDGTPNPSFWDYTGPNSVYLADTTPDHSVILYNDSLSAIATIVVTGINCCEITLTNVSGICDPVTGSGVIEFDIINIPNAGGIVSVVIKNAGNTIVESNPNFDTSSGIHYTSGTHPNGTYTIAVSDNAYNIPNIGIGSDYECSVIRSVTLDCTSCTIISGLNTYIITNPTQITLYVGNTNGYTVNYEVWRNDVPFAGICLPISDPPPGTQIGSGSLNSGVTTTLNYPLNAGGTDPCFYVKFVKQTDPTCKAIKLAEGVTP